MPITYPDRQLTYELPRIAYDYDRGTCTTVWRQIVDGAKQPTEVTTTVSVAAMLADLPQEMAAIYAWLATNAMTKGDIPPGGIVAP